MRQVIERLSEPSTWVGLGGLALAVGVSAEDWASYSALGVSVASFVAGVLLKEKGGQPSESADSLYETETGVK